MSLSPRVSQWSQITPKENLVWRQIACNTHMQSGFWDTKLSRPFGNGQVLAVICDAMICRLVISLFGLGRPAAIPWRVWAIVVNAIQAMIDRWSWSHIGKKVLKRCSPSFANSDSTSTVSRVGAIVRFVTANVRLSPGMILRTARQAMFSRCYLGRFACTFSLQAPTTLRFSRTEVACRGNRCIAARTPTLPKGIVPFALYMCGPIDLSNNNKTPKALTGQVNEAGTAFRAIIGVHREPPVLGVKPRAFAAPLGTLRGCYRSNYSMDGLITQVSAT